MKTLLHYNDQQLIQSYIDGNTNSLEILINRYKDKIYTTIYLLMKDKYLAEDLFQDLFIRIISKLNEGKYKDEGKFLPWALRIAHNLCLDHFRKIKQTTIIKVANDVDIFERFNLSEDGADQCLMKEQSHEIVRKMIAMLPEEQKEMVVLRHYAGLSFKEIASLTNTTVNTALGRMRYALINLRKMMEEKQIAL